MSFITESQPGAPAPKTKLTAGELIGTILSFGFVALLLLAAFGTPVVLLGWWGADRLRGNGPSWDGMVYAGAGLWAVAGGLVFLVWPTKRRKASSRRRQLPLTLRTAALALAALLAAAGFTWWVGSGPVRAARERAAERAWVACLAADRPRTRQAALDFLLNRDNPRFTFFQGEASPEENVKATRRIAAEQPSAEPALVPLLADSDPRLAMKAAAVLGRIGSSAPEAGAALDALVTYAAGHLSESGTWLGGEQDPALEVYDVLQAADTGATEALARAVQRPEVKGPDEELGPQQSYLQHGGVVVGPPSRMQVLFLAIKLGIPGSEQRLGSLLEVANDKTLAEDYLNCGSDALDNAARQWAKRHGYDVTSQPGGPRVRWGEK
ncbi:MAG TPA: HEAT repeat domain-containing protein [Armatimonadota bacterium]